MVGVLRSAVGSFAIAPSKGRTALPCDTPSQQPNHRQHGTRSSVKKHQVRLIDSRSIRAGSEVQEHSHTKVRVQSVVGVLLQLDELSRQGHQSRRTYASASSSRCAEHSSSQAPAPGRTTPSVSAPATLLSTRQNLTDAHKRGGWEDKWLPMRDLAFTLACLAKSQMGGRPLCYLKPTRTNWTPSTARKSYGIGTTSHNHGLASSQSIYRGYVWRSTMNMDVYHEYHVDYRYFELGIRLRLGIGLGLRFGFGSGSGMSMVYRNIHHKYSRYKSTSMLDIHGVLILQKNISDGCPSREWTPSMNVDAHRGWLMTTSSPRIIRDGYP